MGLLPLLLVNDTAQPEEAWPVVTAWARKNRNGFYGIAPCSAVCHPPVGEFPGGSKSAAGLHLLRNDAVGPA